MSDQNGLATVWKTTQDELKLSMTRQAYNTHFQSAQALEIRDGKLVILVNTPSAKHWITQRFEDTILKIVTAQGLDVKGVEAMTTVEYAGNRSTKSEPTISVKLDANGTVKDVAGKVPSPNGNGQHKPKPQPNDEVQFKTTEHELVERSFVKVPHYAVRFWQPVVGRTAFGIYVTIASYKNYRPEVSPTFATLMRNCGPENWVGFNSSLEVLESFELFWREKVEGKKSWVLEVRPFPLLTWEQHMEFLTAPEQRSDHIKWLERYDRESSFSYTKWLDRLPRDQWFS